MRVPATILAAACGLPYFLTRLTWLAGNPIGIPQERFETDPGVQAMGLLLGLCGLLAATLTIGLIRPWGRVFPRWLPVVGGRPVPVLFPTLTAAAIGAVMTIAGKSLVHAYIENWADGEEVSVLYLFLLPLPVWGPALLVRPGATTCTPAAAAPGVGRAIPLRHQSQWPGHEACSAYSALL